MSQSAISSNTGVTKFRVRRAMAVFVALLGLVFWAGSEAGAQERVSDSEARLFQEVISEQIAAFARDDGPAAFAFASPDIQGIFRDPPTFMSMVKRGYPMIYRPQAYDFLEARRHQGITAQAVQFIDQAGRGTIALYIMELQEDGTWRIDGVRLVEQNGAES